MMEERKRKKSNENKMEKQKTKKLIFLAWIFPIPLDDPCSLERTQKRPVNLSLCVYWSRS